MTIGFQSIVEGFGVIQIDQDFTNMLEVQRGTWTGSPVYYTGGQDQQNLVFARPHVDGTWFAPLGFPPGGHAGGEYFNLNDIHGRFNADYAVFANSANARPAPASGVGLCIYDATGTRAHYYSGWSYLKVKANLIVPQNSLTKTFYLTPPAPGKRHYLSINNLWLTRLTDAEEYGYFARFLNETTVEIDPERWSSETTGSFNDAVPPPWHTPSILIAEL